MWFEANSCFSKESVILLMCNLSPAHGSVLQLLALGWSVSSVQRHTAVTASVCLFSFTQSRFNLTLSQFLKSLLIHRNMQCLLFSLVVSVEDKGQLTEVGAAVLFNGFFSSFFVCFVWSSVSDRNTGTACKHG